MAQTGTGLATEALGLLAFDLVGDSARAVLGTALAIKMVAPLTLVTHLPCRALIAAPDLICAEVVYALSVVDQVWQVHLPIFLLQPLPPVSPRPLRPRGRSSAEGQQRHWLSLMRLADDTDPIDSSLIAAALLTVVSFLVLISGTVAGFLLSAVMVGTSRLPSRALRRRCAPRTHLASPGIARATAMPS